MGLYDGSPDVTATLVALAAEIPEIQQTLLANHKDLKRLDRAAHQQQIAGGKVELAISQRLPEELEGLGLFEPGARHTGIGRLSTGLGCPHLETDPDFLGLMVALRTQAGRRIDFLAINSPGAPTNSASDFLAVLAATAHAAGVSVPFGSAGQLDLGNLSASQVKLFNALRKRLGLVRATGVYYHIVKESRRTVLASSAYQRYWTGVVRTGDRLAKFVFEPTTEVGESRALRPGGAYLTEDWRERQARGPVEFKLAWIPYLNEKQTPLEELSEAWDQEQRVEVARLQFPRLDPTAREARLCAILAQEMGANPGNWVRDRHEGQDGHPATEFTALRELAYRASQQARDALPEAAYDSFFESGGRIDAELAAELSRRYAEKRASGHAVPELGELPG